MAHMKLFVFGQPRLEQDGTPIELNLRKALALFVYLAVSNRVHSRDALATLLWPDSDQRESRARLRRTLHRLTQAIGDDALASDVEALRIAPQADLWIDSAAFRQHISAGLAATTDDQIERVKHLRAAVELYSDDLLAGFTLPDSPAFDDWEFFQRESLRQLYGQALEQLVQAYRAQQAWDEAIQYGRRWVALDTLHEPAHRMLMRLYAWGGQHAAAVRQYQECVRVLEAELGETPEEETVALHNAIRTRQFQSSEPTRRQLPPYEAPESEPGAVVAEPEAPNQPTDACCSVGPYSEEALQRELPSTAVEDFLCVAREHELDRLQTLLDSSLASQSRVAFVVGEAGQGKTALLHAFARCAQQAHPDLLIAWGSCNAYTGHGDPYLPFREILELLTGNIEAHAMAAKLRGAHSERLRDTLPAATQALLEVGPDLVGTFISAPRLLERAASAADAAHRLPELQTLAKRIASAPANRHQQDLFEQYARVLQELARRTPLLLLIDDLQWADPGSTDLLLHLGRRLREHRVLIVGAYRPADVALGRDGQRHPLDRVVNELQRDFGEVLLDLSRAEGRAFVDALIDSEPNRLGEAFRAALYRQTSGHPLFTIELLRDLQERGMLVRDETGHWEAVQNFVWSSLPARVEGAIGERVGRLDTRLRELLQVASVEGEEFTAEVIARVLGAEEHDVVRQLSRELDQVHHLVQALGVRRDDQVRLSRYRFQHNLIQRYLYNSLDEIERVYQHEAVGHALETRYGARSGDIAAQLAWHFEAAQLPAQAAAYYVQAGDQARRSAALAEASHYYKAALEAWPQADLGGQATVIRKLGECQWQKGHLQDARALFDSANELYDALGDEEGAGAMHRLIGRLYWEMGNRERSLEHYHRALALLEQCPNSIELAWAISSISQMHMLASENDEAIAWGQRALHLAERLHADEVVIHSLANIGSASFGAGDAEYGRAMLGRSWHQAVKLHLAQEACRAANNLGVGLTYYGLPDEARSVFSDMHAYAMHHHMYLNAGLALLSLTKLDWLTGRWKSALIRYRELVAWIHQGQSSGYLELLADIVFVWMRNDVGQAEMALQVLEKSGPLVADRAEIHTTGPHLGQQIRTLGALGRAEDATAAARRFLELSEQQVYWDTNMSHLVVCRWFADRAPEMHAELHASLAQIERANAQFHAPSTAAGLSEARGIMAWSASDAPRAVEHLRQAAAQWQSIGYPFHQAQALLSLGTVLSQLGETDEAQMAFERAGALLDDLAAELSDPDLRTAFLASELVRSVRDARTELALVACRSV